MDRDAGDDVWAPPGADADALYQPLPFRNEQPLAYAPDASPFVDERANTTFAPTWPLDPFALSMPVAAPHSELYSDDYTPHQTYATSSLHSPASTHSSHSSAQHSHEHDDVDTHDTASDHTDHAAAPPGKQKQSVMQRRRRNRESMRRSRLKEKVWMCVWLVVVRLDLLTDSLTHACAIRTPGYCCRRS